MRNASLLTIVSLILVPFVAQAFSWKAKTAGEEKVALIEFLNGTQVAKEQTAALVAHPHGDHTSEPFLREMMRLKKPLVLPGDLLCRAQVGGKPQVNWVPFTTRETCHKLTLDHSEPIDIGGISIWNFLGNQGKGVPCNVYLLEIDGVRIVDNGDNYARDKEKMLENAPPADVIIASTWNQVNHILGCVQKAEGFNPQTAAFLPAHENELGHRVNHRESYHEMYTDPNRLGNRVFPLERTFPLGWGECFKFRR